MIRQYDKNDLTQVTRIWMDSHIREHGFISTDLWRNGANMLMESIDHSDVYVSVDRQAINGFMQIDGTDIIGLYVVFGRNFRRVATQLLTYAKQLSSSLTLHAYIKDGESIKIYNHCGFKAVEPGINRHTEEPELILTWQNT